MKLPLVSQDQEDYKFVLSVYEGADTGRLTSVRLISFCFKYLGRVSVIRKKVYLGSIRHKDLETVRHMSVLVSC